MCRHPDTGTDPVLGHPTLATVAIDTAARTLDVRPDGPCGGRLIRRAARLRSSYAALA